MTQASVRVPRAARALGAFGLGAIAAFPALLVHQYLWGLGLGLATCAVIWFALAPQWWGRLPYAAGWLTVIGPAAVARPEGDYLIAANLRGYVFLVWAAVVLLASVATLPGRRRGVDHIDLRSQT